MLTFTYGRSFWLVSLTSFTSFTSFASFFRFFRPPSSSHLLWFFCSIRSIRCSLVLRAFDALWSRLVNTYSRSRSFRSSFPCFRHFLVPPIAPQPTASREPIRNNSYSLDSHQQMMVGFPFIYSFSRSPRKSPKEAGFRRSCLWRGGLCEGRQKDAEKRGNAAFGSPSTKLTPDKRGTIGMEDGLRINGVVVTLSFPKT